MKLSSTVIVITLAFQRPVKENIYKCTVFLKWYLDQLSVKDLASVKHCDIKIVLTVPNQCGSTIKQRLSLTLLTTFRCLM